MDFDKDSFDGAWLMATLSDISKKDAPKAIKNIHKILKKDGIIYIAVKKGTGEKKIKKERYANSPRFYAYYNKQELESLLTAAGFNIIESAVSNDSKNKWVEIFAKKR